MDTIYHHDWLNRGLYIKKPRSIMKKFIIKMKNKDSEEYKIENKQFVTFPEAVTHAYIQKAKRGSNWEIVSVSRFYDVS